MRVFFPRCSFCAGIPAVSRRIEDELTGFGKFNSVATPNSCSELEWLNATGPVPGPELVAAMESGLVRG